MKSIYAGTLLAITALWGASEVAAVATPDGCYSSTTGLKLNSTSIYNSMGYCVQQCQPLGYSVMATKDQDCYCGNHLPPLSAESSNSSCTQTCPGYPPDTCGGSGVWSVFLTGVSSDVTNAEASSPSSSSAASTPTTAPGTKATGSSTTSASASVVTVGGQTVVVTASSSPEANSKSSGPNKAGIAAGVVIGIVVIAAIAGGAYVFVRNKRRREVEDEYRRNAAVNSFIGSGKPPTSSSGVSSFNDMRLDPAAMAQRRMSDGSIADSQDYSRRILKVTNA